MIFSSRQSEGVWLLLNDRRHRVGKITRHMGGPYFLTMDGLRWSSHSDTIYAHPGTSGVVGNVITIGFVRLHDAIVKGRLTVTQYARQLKNQGA